MIFMCYFSIELMFPLTKWCTLHAYDGCESQDELQNMEEEGKKYEAYGIEIIRGYDNDYANDLHIALDLIKNSKILSKTKTLSC